MVSFEMLSWGQPVSSWRLLADGSGSWTETERDQGASREAYRLARHDLGADEEAAGLLRALIEQLPFPAPPGDTCASFITDQPYGTLRLEKGASVLELSFNAGCMDASYKPFLEGLRAADGLVAKRGGQAPVTAHERHGSDAGTNGPAAGLTP